MPCLYREGGEEFLLLQYREEFLESLPEMQLASDQTQMRQMRTRMDTKEQIRTHGGMPEMCKSILVQRKIAEQGG